MKIILLQDIKGVGKKDEVINASDGYARNFLLPKKMGVEANAENMSKLKAKQDSNQYKKSVEKEKAEKIAEKLKNITFRPDKALRSEIGVLKVKPLKLRNLTKKRLTDDEVKQKVVNYLRKNEFITRSVVQSICGMTRTTATRQIRRLCEENVLVNKGLQKQPIYFLKEKE